MRRGGNGKGIFSGDYLPPLPWHYFNLRMRAAHRLSSERTIGALTDAELQWIARVVLAESQARALYKLERKVTKMVPRQLTNNET